MKKQGEAWMGQGYIKNYGMGDNQLASGRGDNVLLGDVGSGGKQSIGYDTGLGLREWRGSDGFTSDNTSGWANCTGMDA